MHERICIFIPSYNTRDFVRPTVRRIPWDRLPADLAYEVLFIDNPSGDGTPDQIRAACAELEAPGGCARMPCSMASIEAMEAA